MYSTWSHRIVLWFHNSLPFSSAPESSATDALSFDSDEIDQEDPEFKTVEFTDGTNCTGIFTYKYR